ncbi:MAG: sodium-dependent bicarbonate transport family permease [Betaproteobacteria bacterium]|nr:sodium-dependent bicarbonate transport family permease [Betaproteobacteria bacterium]
MSLDPLILVFALGVIARLLRSDLRFPEPVYEALSIYLLLAIGLKGGVELSHQPLAQVALPAVFAVFAGFALPFLLFPLLLHGVRLKRADAASVAAHYGSVSVVTFAIGSAFLQQRAIPYESFMPVLLALMEAPGILAGVVLARAGGTGGASVYREVAVNKGVVLLIGGIAIGWMIGAEGFQPLKPVFGDLFRGLLAIYLLELGLVVGGRVPDLRRAGVRLVVFGLATPLVMGALGVLLGQALLGLSVGGSILFGVLLASASYIAAPAAMRMAVPEANPALGISAALAVTFPFNVFVNIPLLVWLGGQL